MNKSCSGFSKYRGEFQVFCYLVVVQRKFNLLGVGGGCVNSELMVKTPRAPGVNPKICANVLLFDAAISERNVTNSAPGMCVRSTSAISAVILASVSSFTG